MATVYVRNYEWDPLKSDKNWEKHGIDFETAIEIFDGATLRMRSDRNGEIRWLSIGFASGRVVAVIWTEREERLRIISARVARTKEREIYNKLVGDAS